MSCGWLQRPRPRRNRRPPKPRDNLASEAAVATEPPLPVFAASMPRSQANQSANHRLRGYAVILLATFLPHLSPSRYVAVRTPAELFAASQDAALAPSSTQSTI